MQQRLVLFCWVALDVNGVYGGLFAARDDADASMKAVELADDALPPGTWRVALNRLRGDGSSYRVHAFDAEVVEAPEPAVECDKCNGSGCGACLDVVAWC